MREQAMWLSGGRVVQEAGTVSAKVLRYACHVQGTTWARWLHFSGSQRIVEEDDSVIWIGGCTWKEF